MVGNIWEKALYDNLKVHPIIGIHWWEVHEVRAIFVMPTMDEYEFIGQTKSMNHLFLVGVGGI